jgi:hypothetical protein
MTSRPIVALNLEAAMRHAANLPGAPVFRNGVLIFEVPVGSPKA